MTRIETEAFLFGLVIVAATVVVAVVRLGKWWRRRLFLAGFALAVVANQAGPRVGGVVALAPLAAGAVWRLVWLPPIADSPHYRSLKIPS